MDSDLWTTRLAAAKRQFNMQHHQNLGLNTTSQSENRFNLEDFEVEEETRPDFACPYCYEEFDIAALCSHLEEEHSSESKSTVCPVCSIRVSRDMLSHITLKHGHLFKLRLRHRLRKFAVPPSQTLSLLGKDLRDAHLQALLGGIGYWPNSTSSTNAPDTFLPSALVMNYPTSDTDEITKSIMLTMEDDPKCKVSHHMWKSSLDSSLSREEREERLKQASGRAVFLQDLFASMLLTD